MCSIAIKAGWLPTVVIKHNCPNTPKRDAILCSYVLLLNAPGQTTALIPFKSRQGIPQGPRGVGVVAASQLAKGAGLTHQGVGVKPVGPGEVGPTGCWTQSVLDLETGTNAQILLGWIL